MSELIATFSQWKSIGVTVATNRGYLRELRNFCLYLRNPEVEVITLDDVLGYVNGMIALGWDMNCFLVKCTALRKFFEFCKMKGHAVLDPDLIPVPRKQYKVPRVATEEAYLKMIAVIPSDSKDPRHIRNRAIVGLLWDSAARIGEVLALEVEGVDLDRKKAVIGTEKSKGRRPFREIMWKEDTNIALSAWIKKRRELKTRSDFIDQKALFVSCCSQRYGQRFTIKGAGEMLRRYSNKAKIPYVNAHSLRHHRLHAIVHKGGSAVDVMNIAGHSSLASSTIYTMMYGRELEDRYRVLFGN